MIDKRNRPWRARIQLFDLRQPTEPVADTDTELEPGQLNPETLPSLGHVASWLIGVALAFHKPLPVGLDMVMLTHRLKSLRPTLSRRGGNAVWRVPYTVDGAPWLACVYVERACLSG